jgi:hypothetical protein
MDAASAAAMSDRDRNRWFRRRWREPSPVSIRQARPAAGPPPALTGHELLEMWRQELARGTGRSPGPLWSFGSSGDCRSIRTPSPEITR